MTDRIEVALALDMLLGFHELDDGGSDPSEVSHLITLMRERHNEIVDVLTDPKPEG